MSLVDALIIAVVVAATVLCIRRLALSSAKGKCSGCSSESSCSVARSGSGECPAARDMVADAEHAAGTHSPHADQGHSSGCDCCR
ncbi:MAG: FeoB-associated Cys-rich membrane protein [Atopobiaceae bacterium]|nr:FeoB-associated Cys-rich membrane protein [Atopobiaceae bacterium]MCI2174049.1 FeoB-associated Cys-rich membrane protein [Atopobiaceae bacterium]MCI2207861.1 FeoB-associated Cys-rich membrane protein [Atopobiaceae bacterium]